MRSIFTRLFVVTALLVILPFSGIRVICFELPAEESAAAVADHELTDCERLCALHRPADAPSPPVTSTSDDSDGREVCALTADGAILDCVSFSAIAVVRAQPPAETPAIARNLYVDSSRLHLDPALAPAGPPPKRAR